MFNIYVANISLRFKEDHIKQLFEAFGEVLSVKLLQDFKKRESKGIAFVEMRFKKDAETAIEKLNRCDLDGKKLMVSMAREASGKSSPGKKKPFKKKF